MRYSYEITPRKPDAGDGWRLRLLDGDIEVGGGAFPLPPVPVAETAAWWDALPEQEREYWLTVGSDTPAGAHRAFLLAEAHAAAEDEGAAWVEDMEPEGGGQL